MIRTVLSIAAAALCTTALNAQLSPEAVETLQRSIPVERDGDVTIIPFDAHMGKLALDANVDGVERQFIFDTGSPTMISRDLAENLDLTTIGSNTGRDANGREVTTDIAVVDRLTIGGATFRQVPVLIADFDVADPNGCFFDGGVIGSEIFPAQVWHIDAEARALIIADKVGDLPEGAVAAEPIKGQLFDFGYPHAPVFGYSIGEFSDRALFDTGNANEIVLFERITGDERVSEAFVAGSLREGRGSSGVSAGGLGDTTNLLRFEIDGFRLGETALGVRTATTRTVPPSLMGLGITATHNVTLDYPGEQILLSPRSAPDPAVAHAGYGLMLVGSHVEVVQLFEDSAATRAGLRLGDVVIALDGNELRPATEPCKTMRWLVEDRPAQSAKSLTVERDGERVVIELPE